MLKACYSKPKKPLWQRLSLWASIGILGMVGLSIIFPYPWIFLQVWLSVRHIEAKQRVLLYQTDHRAVLAVGQEMIKDKKRYPDEHYLGNDPRLPRVIRQLDARDISKWEDRVIIEMGGGFLHYGFVAYAPGAREDGAPEITTKRLLPGLWFYTESNRIIEP